MCRIPHAPRPVRMGRLRRLRVDELAEERSAALLDHSEHLLQLRVGVRHPRLRRQGDARRPEDRRQPGPSRQPRPHVREGRRHAQPARGSRSRALSAEARRARAAAASGSASRWDEVLDDIGGAHPQGDRRGPPARADVPRRPARRGRLRQPRAAGVGPRRAQQPHERLLVVGAARAFPVDRRGSAVARSREREDDPAAVVASRVRALLQSARAADHRRQVDAARS